MSTPEPALPRYRLGVTQLIPWFFPTGDLHSHQQDQVSSVEGQAAHRRVQKKWPSSVLREARVSVTWQTEQFELQLNGRLDGVTNDQQTLRVTEIKTVRQPATSLPAQIQAQHRLQARLYAALWLQQNPELTADAVVLELLYVDLREGSETLLSEAISRTELLSMMQVHYAALMAWFLDLTVHRIQRNRMLQQLAFPFTCFREGQYTLAASLFRCIRDRTMALVEAPTGSGKSLATLFPALKAMGEGLVRQIFFATTKNAGQLSALEALAQLQPAGLRILQVQGREKLCSSDATCHAGGCERQRNMHARLPQARAEALQKGWITSGLLCEIALRHNCCPQGLQSSLMPWMDVLIGDVNYVFAPGNRIELLFQLNQPLLLADEAHNLPDRARAMFSAELRVSKYQKLLDTLPDSARDLLTATRRLLRLLNNSRLEPATVSRKLARPLEFFVTTGEQMMVSAIDLLAPLDNTMVNLLQQGIRDARQWLTLLPDVQDDFTCLPLAGLDSGWLLVCLSPARLLQRSYSDLGSAVFFSASLTPPEFFQTLLGLPDSTFRCRLPTAFPPARQCTLLYSGTSLRYTDRDHPQHLPGICRLIQAVWEARPGRYWVFAPSFEYLDALCVEFSQRCAAIPTLRQKRDMTMADRDAFLQRFQEPQAGGLVGLLSLGSVFTESINLPGEALIGVIVLGPGLPQPSQINTAMASYFSSRGLDGQRFTYLLPGWQKVIQAAGRVIRSPQDRGVVILADQRFTSRNYQTLLPPHWQVQSAKTADQMLATLKKFWSEQLD